MFGHNIKELKSLKWSGLQEHFSEFWFNMNWLWDYLEWKSWPQTHIIKTIRVKSMQQIKSILIGWGETNDLARFSMKLLILQPNYLRI